MTFKELFPLGRRRVEVESTSNKILSELSNARKLDRKYKISEQLNLTEDNDKVLARAYIAERLIRQKIYNCELNASRSITTILEDSRIGKVVNKFEISRMWLENQASALQEAIELLIKNNYKDNELRWVKEIELSINRLFFYSSKMTKRGEKIFKPGSSDFLRNWSDESLVRLADVKLQS